MERQVCQFQTVPTEGFTPSDCAQNCAQWRFVLVQQPDNS